jgi:hypothetical protein
MKKIALLGICAGAGFFGACLALGHWGLRRLDSLDLSLEPYCDGDLPDMETVESDGFITCHFSGPIRPIPQS